MAPRAEILIAEDEPSARRGFRALFEGEGYAVRTARDGEEAVAKFIERRPDAVLLDVMMPKMNGIAACAEMRKADLLVPILFFTAMPSDVSTRRSRQRSFSPALPRCCGAQPPPRSRALMRSALAG